LRVFAEAIEGEGIDHLGMRDATYAVSWKQEDGSEGTGRLELGPDGLSLEGRNEGLPVRFQVPCGEVKSFRLARANGERLRGRPTLVLELAGGETLRIASLAQPGIVSEVADRLTELRPS
jgi:hypothetical protein